MSARNKGLTRSGGRPGGRSPSLGSPAGRAAQGALTARERYCLMPSTSLSRCSSASSKREPGGGDRCSSVRPGRVRGGPVPGPRGTH